MHAKLAAATAVFVVVFSCCINISSSKMTGGLTEQDPTKSEYQEMAWKSLKGLNDQASNNGPYYYVPIKVAKVHTQVVAGQKTVLEVYVGESSCKKGELQVHELTKSNCQAKEGGSRALYKVELWEKPWENFEQFNVEKIRDVGASEAI